MQRSLTAAILLSLATVPAHAKATMAQTWPPAWEQQQHRSKTAVVHRRHRAAKAAPPALGQIKAAERKIDALQVELADMRREFAEVRAQIGRPAWDGGPVPFVSLETPSAGPREAPSLPDLRLPRQEPALPVPPPAAFLGPQEAADDRATVAASAAYLVRTATPGYTMARQGPEVAIGRLHPHFQVLLAAAVRIARANGLPRAGVFSAYRPPAFGVGGFGDKFNSLHSYGLAADMAGIGAPGTAKARQWYRIVQSVGLYLPYGPDNGREWNHVQLVPTKIAASSLRRTITASGPKDLRAMWTASGVTADVQDEPHVSSARLLPPVEWGGRRSE
jgi:hypothetical protein